MFGLLGKSLSHSISPEIHALLGDYEYRLFCVEPDKLSDFFKTRDFDGINVTIPYKRDAASFCDELSPAAKTIGSVNTVVKRHDGSLFGDNTDYFGFTYLLNQNSVNVSGKKALVLGTGGSSLTVTAVLRDFGASDIINVSRTGKINYENVYEHSDADIIINTTPAGMYPKTSETLLDLKRFPACSQVIDIIYNPLRTRLLLSARELGIPHANGLTMLIAQAHRASELFQGKNLDVSLISDITKMLRKRRNIVLIGMPGAGKTTAADRLSIKTGLPVTDTDYAVEISAGMSIPEIFAQYGESEFRRLESIAVFEAGNLCGNIISVGGGAVQNSENRANLMQNGFVIYLRRDIGKLCTENRPLSKNTDALRQLEAVRAPIYEAMADFTVTVTEGDPDAAVLKILDNLTRCD